MHGRELGTQRRVGPAPGRRQHVAPGLTENRPVAVVPVWEVHQYVPCGELVYCWNSVVRSVESRRARAAHRLPLDGPEGFGAALLR